MRRGSTSTPRASCSPNARPRRSEGIRGGLAIVRVPGRFYEASVQPDVVPIADWMETKR
jgi:hypothetical protein